MQWARWIVLSVYLHLCNNDMTPIDGTQCLLFSEFWKHENLSKNEIKNPTAPMNMITVCNACICYSSSLTASLPLIKPANASIRASPG